ncbi:SDR family oxidoreductase [Rhodocyclus gracilis]|uniref:SDR family NAD(P)-dependent oxidoreductase n=1 Tax=Rhodocyclus tenuis TaxID=1066 RepID=A0A6L5JYQ7_RHOTE|nr:SDR family oxidoreductase [Rhodocyclus gracilis]MQY52329.1 SDR family NAD(P)-dependent oxidoreductase [Rhodocyclus gracilis]
MASPTELGHTTETGFGRRTTADDVTAGLSLRGKTILVTGSTTGLGLETCRALALRGAHVLGTGRTQDAAKHAMDSLRGEANGYACDLADADSIRACISQIRAAGFRLDAIIGNAGIMALPTLQQAYGYELQFFTNHVGHFMLVTGLLDQLTDDGRVVMLSSSAHAMAPREGIQFEELSGERAYSPWRHYGQSKLANLLFAKELQRRFTGTARTAYAVHPGATRTQLARHMGRSAAWFTQVAGSLFLRNVGQGAATTVFAAVHPQATALAGQYLADCRLARASKRANDEALARRLWTVSEHIVQRLP